MSLLLKATAGALPAAAAWRMRADIAFGLIGAELASMGAFIEDDEATPGTPKAPKPPKKPRTIGEAKAAGLIRLPSGKFIPPGAMGFYEIFT